MLAIARLYLEKYEEIEVEDRILCRRMIETFVEGPGYRLHDDGRREIETVKAG